MIVFIVDAPDFPPLHVGSSGGLSMHNGIESETLTTEQTRLAVVFFALTFFGYDVFRYAFAMRCKYVIYDVSMHVRIVFLRFSSVTVCKNA